MIGRPVQGRHAVDLGLVHVDAVARRARGLPSRSCCLRRVRQAERRRPCAGRRQGEQEQPVQLRRIDVQVRSHDRRHRSSRTAVPQIESGSNRSSILPRLSANESRRTPTLSSRVRWRLASGVGFA